MTAPKPKSLPFKGLQTQFQLGMMLERIEQTSPHNQNEVFKTIVDATRFKIDNRLRGSEKMRLVQAVAQMYDKLLNYQANIHLGAKVFASDPAQVALYKHTLALMHAATINYH